MGSAALAGEGSGLRAIRRFLSGLGSGASMGQVDESDSIGGDK